MSDKINGLWLYNPSIAKALSREVQIHEALHLSGCRNIQFPNEQCQPERMKKRQVLFKHIFSCCITEQHHLRWSASFHCIQMPFSEISPCGRCKMKKLQRWPQRRLRSWRTWHRRDLGHAQPHSVCRGLLFHVWWFFLCPVLLPLGQPAAGTSEDPLLWDPLPAVGAQQN